VSSPSEPRLSRARNMAKSNDMASSPPPPKGGDWGADRPGGGTRNGLSRDGSDVAVSRASQTRVESRRPALDCYHQVLTPPGCSGTHNPDTGGRGGGVESFAQQSTRNAGVAGTGRDGTRKPGKGNLSLVLVGADLPESPRIDAGRQVRPSGPVWSRCCWRACCGGLVGPGPFGLLGQCVCGPEVRLSRGPVGLWSCWIGEPRSLLDLRSRSPTGTTCLRS